MGHTYQSVQWNAQKKKIDLVLWGGILIFLVLFTGLGALWYPNITAETLIVRALASAAFVLLHVILSIGPLARLDVRFLPLLYNRRHLGVSMFLLAAAHGFLGIVQFHAMGNMNPILSIFVNDATMGSDVLIPFQPLGFIALSILFVMAATSHDFWLAQLSAPVWKALHMMVYAAYVLLVGHVAFGAIQDQSSVVPFVLLLIGAFVVLGLHLVSAFKGLSLDANLVAGHNTASELKESYVDVCAESDIPKNRAVIRTLAGERVAIFNNGGEICAVSNVCQHQNGPLGEGRIIDGYITCPWHGYQYCPRSGRSPEPFTEWIPVFNTRIENGRVMVSTQPKRSSNEAATQPKRGGGEAAKNQTRIE